MNSIAPTYSVARTVAKTIEEHFTLQIEKAHLLGEKDLAPAPTASIVETMIDVAFWTSMRREEGYSPKISLAFFPPDHTHSPLIFAHKLVLSPGVLTKIAPAIERPGIHLGIWFNEEGLYIWGTTREIPSICFVLEVIEPGLLIIKHRGVDGFGKFVNVAVLKGDQVKIIDDKSASLPDCPSLLTSLLRFSATSNWHDSVNVLVQLSASMRAHQRGGTLLVVPTGSEAWRRSIMQPIKYDVAPAYKGLTSLMQQDISFRNELQWQEELRRAVDKVAGLTAVDGATVISDTYELLAFGAKIRRPDGRSMVEQIIMTEPIAGNEPVKMNPTLNGGTRHFSAAQFAHDQRDAMALVASQDGKFTIFSWSGCEEMVHAHRVDSLLL